MTSPEVLARIIFPEGGEEWFFPREMEETRASLGEVEQFIRGRIADTERKARGKAGLLSGSATCHIGNITFRNHQEVILERNEEEREILVAGVDPYHQVLTQLMQELGVDIEHPSCFPWESLLFTRYYSEEDKRGKRVIFTRTTARTSRVEGAEDERGKVKTVWWEYRVNVPGQLSRGWQQLRSMIPL